MAVFYALVVGRFLYRTLRFDMLPAILFRTAMMTASILMIVATSEVFGWVLTVGQIPQTVAALDRRLRARPARAAAADQRASCCWRASSSSRCPA